MMDMGFEPAMRKLVQRSDMTPAGQRRTYMFSATFPPPMQKLAANFMDNYIWIESGVSGAQWPASSSACCHEQQQA